MNFDKVIFNLMDDYDLVLKEAFDPTMYNQQVQKTPVSLVVGRFNPWTRGHAELLKTAKYPLVVALIKGAKSSLDKDRNPFNADTQREIIMRSSSVGSGIADTIVINGAAFLPYIVSELRNKGYEPKELLIGTDRKKSYAHQFKDYLPFINSKMRMRVLERDPDADDASGISATKVREALKSGNYQAANNMMVGLDKNLFDKLRAEMFSR